VITANGTKYRWSTQDLPKVNHSAQSFFIPLLTEIYARTPQLVTNNRKKKLIAELHKSRRVFGKRKAYLEVAPAGLTMLDQIVVSLVYVEKKRREREHEVDDSWVDKEGGDSGGGDGGGGDGGGGADGGGGGGGS